MFKSYVGALSPALLARLEHAEQPSPLLLSVLSDDEKVKAHMLNYILAQTLSGSSLQMLTNVEECTGYEGSRQVVRREGPTAGSAQVGQLTSILRPASQANLSTARMRSKVRASGLDLRTDAQRDLRRPIAP